MDVETPPSYTVVETLCEGPRPRLFRAVRNADGRRVILKVLDPRHSRPRDVELLKHEYAIGKALDLESILKPLAFETFQGMPALVLDDFGGEVLDRSLDAPLDAERFLDLAIRIAAAVADLHQEEVIHRDLKPQNLLVNSATGQVKIADLGLASRLPREDKPFESPSFIEGSLPYLSPEQTGHVNRPIDFRSDLYAIGITFYEMLTARLPFEARDALEWVYCHVARAPQPPSELAPGSPEVLSAIVLKLLGKMPEDRYQTARGLQRDLERCLSAWRAVGRIEPFPLAEHDFSGRLQIPKKLYGREDEAALLLGALERVVETGFPELVLVSGYSGIGKSALIHELNDPIAREHGFFVSGKFDQFKRDIPYSTIVQALRELVLQLLAESEPRIAVWRQRLLAALGDHGQLIVDVIPPLELVIGRQPPAPEVPLTEAQNRFCAVFRRFVGAFAQKEHPLALFLDDLQWADAASLALIHDLMTHPEIRDLLIIGAYRDNEVTPSHLLMSTLDQVRQEGVRTSRIVLGPIAPEHLLALISESLHCRPEDAAPLADLVCEKTAGNAFFVIQFLTALYEERLIEFDARAGAFRWDTAKIRAKGFTDNVVALMVQKLARLPESTQRALKLLACLGSTVDIDLLTTALGGFRRRERETHADLEEAARAGLVVRLDGTYRFLHDRVEEAAYSLIPEGERAAVHLQIGRLLASQLAPAELEEKIFDVVNQLDRGAALMTSREERERAAELNLVAGKRAERAAAYASALTYFSAGAALLSDDRWDGRYELAFELELHRAECETVTGELSSAEERLSRLSPRTRGLVDSAAVACARTTLYIIDDRSDRAIEVCIGYLRRIGVTWSPHPTEEEVLQEYEQMWGRLGGRPIESLIDLPPMTDPALCATMNVLTSALPPAALSDERLYHLIVGRMANLSLEHGNSDGACLTYVWLGMILGPQFGDYRAGVRFGKLGLDLLEKRGLLRFKARVYGGFGILISHWTSHVRTGLALVRRAFDAAQETGDLQFASYCCHGSISLLLSEGSPLVEVQREAENGLDFVRKAKFGLLVDSMVGQERLVRTLRGLTPALSSFSDAEFDEGRFEQHLAGDPRLAFASCMYWICKLQARLIAGDYASALDAASNAEPLLWIVPPFHELVEYHFYRALALAARDEAASLDERRLRRQALLAHCVSSRSGPRAAPRTSRTALRSSAPRSRASTATGRRRPSSTSRRSALRATAASSTTRRSRTRRPRGSTARAASH